MEVMPSPKQEDRRHDTTAEAASLSKPASQGSEKDSGSEHSAGSIGVFEYFGWIYHLGVNSIGHEYCHLRFLFIRGNHVQMFKRDPHENPGINPIRKGVVGPTFMVEELGRRKVNHGDVYVVRFYNRLDETKKGEIACATAGEARKWMEAFDHAKQQAEYELSKGGSSRNKLNKEDEINLEGHRPRVRRYAHELKKLIRIGQGPESLLRQSSGLAAEARSDGYFERDVGDVIEAQKWKCVRTVNALAMEVLGHLFPKNFRISLRLLINKEVNVNITIVYGDLFKKIGVRIFEDVADSQRGKSVLVKASAVVDASADTAFEVILNIEPQQRYEWDMLTGDLELVDSYDGHYDVVYGTFDPKYLTRWHSKRDFVYSRQWFRGQDGTYTTSNAFNGEVSEPGYYIHYEEYRIDEKAILQVPVVLKKKPPRSGYRRTKINPSTWEIRDLNTSGSSMTRCLVTQMLEIHSSGWFGWKKNHSSKFEKSVPYALLCQVSGLKEYISANPALKFESATTVVKSKFSHVSIPNGENEEEAPEEFYDAVGGDSSSSDEESDDDGEFDQKEAKVKLRNVSWALTGLALRRTSGPDVNKELDPNVVPTTIDPSQFNGSLHKGKDENDTNCWTSPSGMGFKIRGKNYLKDNSKVMGGDPLLKLLAVDWFTVDKSVDQIALHPKSLVQSEAGKKLPFILVINLQVPAKPNYSLVLYYAAERPPKKNSLLAKFVDGSDIYRDARFKLIPSIVEGYWMVKRAVGTKACLLGKAVTCKYFRQDNFLEIDVDIGSSSVARSVIGLVLGYVTSLVVDLAILIEGKEEEVLPEYILGTVRLNRIRLNSAVHLDV
ncbi:hypothetical protein TIFTF001_016385 [Ficus carica]|uniref:START domain-containing protein n=1 Tax=Ficus carica TaxID=3494 RepID=A0AA88A676_FICCA|nr:hypothetical protein TIFTF001_016385 [Ficus carica]